ncbi:MAG TPA: ABC transporter permease [Acidobacteriaceae bacterium]|nr:ABC transporter permease [Acidobacteriaceae bacterium]
MNVLVQNMRHALRQLRKSPGFTLTVVITLALGIGANAAVFTLFDQVLLRMLPVEKPQQLVRFEFKGSFSGSASSFGGGIENYFSYPMYKDLRDQNKVFSGMLAAMRTNIGLTWQNHAADKDAEVVSGNYFQVLGLKPALGRLLTPQDDTAAGANPVLVLSYNYWRSRFAARPDVVGQTVQVNGHPFTVIGVAPENFESAIGGYEPGAFVPISMCDVAMPWMATRHNLTNHQSIWLTIVARLKPGVTREQAQTSLAPLWHSLRAYELTLYPHASARFKRRFLDETHLLVLNDSRGFSPGRSDLKTPLIILMSMAGLLVLMCAINVATLLLLRAVARAREMAMRYALGAKRGRITGQLLTEGVLIGVMGALGGVALAPVVAKTLVHLLVNASPGSEPYSASVDTTMLLFALGVGVAASVLFSLAPVLHFMRPNLVEALRQNTGTASKGSQRFRKIAVGAQIALSVVLLGGAGLFVRTLDNLRAQSLGYNTRHLLQFSLDTGSAGYSEQQKPAIIQRALDAIQQIPGVTEAAGTTDPVLDQDMSINGYKIAGYKPKEGESMDFESPYVTAGYFAALEQPILAGRAFTAADAKGAEKVAVVNLAFAKKFFGSAQDALGGMIGQDKPDARIVGVVGDTRHYDLRTVLGPAVYHPYPQMEHPTDVQMYVRTAQAPEAVEPAIRKAMQELDPLLVVDGMNTMQQQVSISAGDERALAILAAGFSGLAMLLAGVGLYGVLAYATEQRKREIGVRLALGAQRRRVVMVVVREMALVTAISVAVAVPVVVALARLFQSQLYGVKTYDPAALGGALVVTALMVALAAAIPARRAAGVQPMQALREE